MKICFWLTISLNQWTEENAVNNYTDLILLGLLYLKCFLEILLIIKFITSFINSRELGRFRLFGITAEHGSSRRRSAVHDLINSMDYSFMNVNENHFRQIYQETLSQPLSLTPFCFTQFASLSHSSSRSSIPQTQQ